MFTLMNPVSLKTDAFRNVIDRRLDLTDVKKIPNLNQELQVCQFVSVQEPGLAVLRSVCTDYCNSQKKLKIVVSDGCHLKKNIGNSLWHLFFCEKTSAKVVKTWSELAVVLGG